MLVNQLIVEYAETFFSEIDRLILESDDVKTTITKIINLCEQSASSEETSAMCLCGILAVESKSLGVSTKKLLKDFFDSFRWKISSVYSRMYDESLARDQASVFVSSIEWVMLIYTLQEDKNLFTQLKSHYAYHIA